MDIDNVQGTTREWKITFNACVTSDAIHEKYLLDKNGLFPPRMRIELSLEHVVINS